MNRNRKNIITERLLLIPAGVAALLFLAIIIALWFKSGNLLSRFGIVDLLFSSVWSPMSGKFGYLPFITGTLWVTLLSMGMAIPISLLTALYLSEYAGSRTRTLVQPFIDLLAGIPSVVYGLFGILLIVPVIRDVIAPLCSVTTSGYCILAGGLVLSIMVFPILISISYEVMRSVPLSRREAALALGATHWETTKHVVLRSAFPGLVAAMVLGFSRAIGETMAVLMVVGNVPQIASSIFDPAYPIPALIANNYGEMMSIPLYDSALMFAGFLLVVVIMIFIILSKIILRNISRRMVQ